jgi:hypothetical protein
MEGHLQKVTWMVCGRFIIAAIFAAFVLLGLPLLVSAAETTVVINEIMWMGSSVSSVDEWIELKNTTGEDINLTNWSIGGAGSSSSAITIAAGVIPANGYFLISNYETGSSAISDSITADIVISGVSLANGGGKLTLKDPASNMIDATPIGSWEEGNNNTAPVGQRNSMERNNTPGDGVSWGNWHTCLDNNCYATTFWDIEGTDYGTPGATNSQPSIPVSPEPAPTPSPSPSPSLAPSPVATPKPDIEYSDAIVINEFLPNPVGADAEGEFIELKNTGEEEVNLKDWQLDDSEGGSSSYVILEGILIQGGEAVAFQRSTTGLALNNGGDEVRLFSPDGETKDEHSYDVSVSEGVVRARDEDGAWQWSATATPGEANIIYWEQEGEEESEDDQEYSDSIIINEFLTNPTGSDTTTEFIELKNTGEEEVDLEGWELDDGDGGSGRHDISAGEKLAAGEIKVFWRSDTKIALNNSGDEVRLFSPNREEKASYTYEEAVGENVSHNWVDNEEYVLSTTATPGEKNIITESEEESGEVAGVTVFKVPLKDVRNQAVGSTVEIQGVISAPPGVFGDKIMYLAGSGIQIYFYRAEYPELEVGDKVKVRGILTTSLGEHRIKLAAVEDITLTGEAAAPEPHKVQTGEVGKNLEGSLVVIAGRVARTSGDTFYVDDGSGEVKVFIKKTTGIDKPKMKKGMAVTIMGIVSQTSAGYRILPRWQGDVSVGMVAGISSFPAAGDSVIRQKYSWLLGQNHTFLGVLTSISGYLLLLAIKNKEPLLTNT